MNIPFCGVFPLRPFTNITWCPQPTVHPMLEFLAAQALVMLNDEAGCPSTPLVPERPHVPLKKRVRRKRHEPRAVVPVTHGQFSCGRCGKRKETMRAMLAHRCVPPLKWHDDNTIYLR